jgi:hypothetical protein
VDDPHELALLVLEVLNNPGDGLIFIRLQLEPEYAIEGDSRYGGIKPKQVILFVNIATRTTTKG